MKTTVDYSKLTPQDKTKKALEDIARYLGRQRYAMLAPQMSTITIPNQFAFLCSVAGIEGFPVKAWFESFHGEGSFDRLWAPDTQTPEEATGVRNS